MLDFGERVKDLRIKNKMSISYVTKKLKVSRTTVENWEGGVKLPTTEHLLQLADLYRTSLDYLIGVTPGPTIVLEGLTPRQRDVIYMLISDLREKRPVRLKELTSRQKEIVAALINEFYFSNREERD